MLRASSFRAPSRRAASFGFVLALTACVDEPAAEQPPPAGAVDQALIWVDHEALAALLDESIEVAPGGSRVVLEGWMVRLAVDPLIAGRSSLRFTPEGDGGLRVEGIPEGSVWARIGLRDGDVLRRVDGKQPGAELEQLRQRYGECPSEVLLELERDGRVFEIALEIRRDRTWKRTRRSYTDLRRPTPSERSRPGSGDDRHKTIAGLGSIADHVRCRDPDHCEVSMALVEAYKSNRESFARQARIVPSIRKGEMSGFKFYGLRPGSLLKLLGVKNGDLLESIDGEPLRLDDSLEHFERFAELRRGDRIELGFERKGATRELEIEFVESFAAQE